MPAAYEPSPQHPSGKSNEEIYRLTQKQRRLERAIRATKREVAAAERAYEADPTLKNQTTANQLREQLRRRQDALGKLVGENKDVLTRDLRREWAGDMPKVRVPKGNEWKVFPQTRDAMGETKGVRRLGRPEITRLQEASNATFATMTEDERTAIRAYTTGRHNEINQRLYGTRKQTAKVRARADEAIRSIDSAITRFNLGQNVVVFSGTDAAHYDGWTVGDVRELKGFVSASVRYKDALAFRTREEQVGNVGMMLTIRVPSGTASLFVGENTSFSAYQGEMILGRGLKYRVMARGDRSMELEVVNGGDS